MHSRQVVSLLAVFVFTFVHASAGAGWQPPPVTLPEAEQEQLQFRIWKSADGRQAELAFVRSTDGKVFLKRKDGKVASVPIDGLSKEDQAWVRRMISEQAKPQSDSAEKNIRFEPVQGGGLNLTVNMSWDEGLKLIAKSLEDSPSKRIPVLIENPKGNLIHTGVRLTDAEIASIGKQHFGNGTRANLSTAGDGVIVFLSIELGAAKIPQNLIKALEVGKLDQKKPLHWIMDTEQGRFLLLHDARGDFTVLQVKGEASTAATGADGIPSTTSQGEGSDVKQRPVTISWHDTRWLADAKKSGILHAPNLVWKKTGDLDETRFELVVETSDARSKSPPQTADWMTLGMGY